jgi:hypothetical protein
MYNFLLEIVSALHGNCGAFACLVSGCIAAIDDGLLSVEEF